MTDDVLLQYIKDVKKIPLLTESQEKELANAIKKGSKKAIDKLVNANLRLVIKMAKQYTKNESKIMELIQEGNIGLMKAAQKFDKSFGVKFSSYATWWIKQSFSRFLNSQDRLIKLPVRKEYLMRQITNEAQKYESKYGKIPSCNTLAKILKMNLNDIKEIRYLENYNTFSLDQPLTKNDDISLYEILPNNDYNPENECLENEFKYNINKCLNLLNDREQDILKYRFGLNGINKSTSYKALGQKHSISAESVRQTQLRAIKKLQEKKSIIKTLV